MMINYSRLLVILGLATMVLCSCNGGSASSTTRAVQYPSTWPIKPLTVPNGARQIPLHNLYEDDSAIIWEMNGEILAPGEAFERKRWEICFEPGLSGQVVADHIDSCLKPLGFRLYREGTPPQSRRMYISKDYKIQVNLDFMDLKPIKLANKPGWKGYRLTASVYSRPRPDVSSTKPIP